MTIFQRWRFRAQVRTIRADLDRISQRIDHTETRVNYLSTHVEAITIAFKRPVDN